MGLLTSAGLLSGSGVEAEKWMQGQAHSHGEMGAAHAQANPVAAAANAAKEAGAKPVSLAPYVDALPRLPVIHPYKGAESWSDARAEARARFDAERRGCAGADAGDSNEGASRSAGDADVGIQRDLAGADV